MEILERPGYQAIQILDNRILRPSFYDMAIQLRSTSKIIGDLPLQRNFLYLCMDRIFNFIHFSY